MIFSKLIHKWKSLKYYVIADPTDNSVTLSQKLFNHIRNNVQGDDSPSVFVLRIPHHGTYGFMLNPEINQPTQLCQIQYNSKYRCIGFETLCPSVNSMFFDYGLAALRPVKFSVSVRKTAHGKIYYQIDAPTPKLIRQCKASSETHGKLT